MKAKMPWTIIATCTLIAQFADKGASAERLSYWSFDDAGGRGIRDSVGWGHGIVSGASPAAGRFGEALRFDGVDDYVTLPDNDPVWLPQNDFSISFWVYFERRKGSSEEESEVILDFNHGASSDPLNELGYNVQRRGDTGKIAFQMTTESNSDEDLFSETIPVEDKWCHIVVTRENVAQRIYIDGRLDSSRTCSATPVDFTGGYDDDQVSMARYTTTLGSPRYHLKGVLDEVMIFDGALSAGEIWQLYEYGAIRGYSYVDALGGSDTHDGLSPQTAWATIQKAIDSAEEGDVINVYPGVYREEIRFSGKAITVQSIGGAAVLEAPDGFAVSFYRGEGPDSILRNVVISTSYIGIFVMRSSPTITNVTVVENVLGVEAYGDASPRISNSIFWNNADSDLYGCQTTYSCIEHASQGEGNFSEAPLFVDAQNSDYHLRSERGRYWPEHDVWVLDDVTSPCVDAGDPAGDFSAERKPNGGRLNIGAYGGTASASMSAPAFSADVNGDGIVDADDLEMFTDLWEEQRQEETAPPLRRR